MERSDLLSLSSPIGLLGLLHTPFIGDFGVFKSSWLDDELDLGDTGDVGDLLFERDLREDDDDDEFDEDEPGLESSLSMVVVMMIATIAGKCKIFIKHMQHNFLFIYLLCGLTFEKINNKIV